MKKVILICCAVLCCACKHQEKSTDEIGVLYAVIKHYESEKSRKVYPIDTIMHLPEDFRFKNDEILYLYEENKSIKTEDIQCFKTQIKVLDNANINHWSSLKTKLKYEFIDVKQVAKHPVFSEAWKQEYYKTYDHKNLIQFSYPLFNCNRDEAIILAYYFFGENLEKKSMDILFFKKNNLKEWIYSGGGDIIINIPL